MLFVVPCALVVLLMMIVPVVRTVSFAFSKVTLPSFDTEFTGLENFRKILAMEEFPAVIRNTFIWVAGSVILRVSLGFLAVDTAGGFRRTQYGSQGDGVRLPGEAVAGNGGNGSAYGFSHLCLGRISICYDDDTCWASGNFHGNV